METTSFKFIHDHIKELVIRTYLDMGRTSGDVLANHMANRTTSMIERKYRQMSVEDFNNIFNLGIEGKFGEFKGLTFPTIARWFELYHLRTTPKSEDFSMQQKLIKLNKMILEKIKEGGAKIPNLTEMFTNEKWLSERKKQERFL